MPQHQDHLELLRTRRPEHSTTKANSRQATRYAIDHNTHDLQQTGHRRYPRTDPLPASLTEFSNPTGSGRARRRAAGDADGYTLPDGYATLLDEDASNISCGQKQLLTIARAFLANPSILILDEATSNVDTRTEVLIQQAMTRLCQGRTSFVIAHRLSTIRDADTIVVMDAGSIVEQGRHDQLLRKHGLYHTLYNSQFTQAQDPVVT
jgi:ABC-type glutathione transport system ATPase component